MAGTNYARMAMICRDAVSSSWAPWLLFVRVDLQRNWRWAPEVNRAIFHGGAIAISMNGVECAHQPKSTHLFANVCCLCMLLYNICSAAITTMVSPQTIDGGGVHGTAFKKLYFFFMFSVSSNNTTCACAITKILNNPLEFSRTHGASQANVRQIDFKITHVRTNHTKWPSIRVGVGVWV